MRNQAYDHRRTSHEDVHKYPVSSGAKWVRHSPAKRSTPCGTSASPVRPGRVFTLLGPNGAGKTTTLRLIATMLKPTSGTITVAGVDVVKNPVEARKRMGFLTGNTGLYDRLTPDEMVKYYADLHGMETRDVQASAR